MISFQGTYFDGKRSRAVPVMVTFTGASLSIQRQEETVSFTVAIQQCSILPPLGKTSRSIKLPGGAQIETHNLEAMAEVERAAGANRGMRLVHFFERYWKTVAGALVGLAFFAWAFLTYGIPFLAKRIAYTLPPTIMEEVSRQTLKALD